MVISSTILAGGTHISEAKKSSLQELRAQQQQRQQQFQQQNLQTQAVTTQAASSGGAPNLADNSVTSPKIKDGEVKTQDIANNAVTRAKISPGAVGVQITLRGGPNSESIAPGETGSAEVSCLSGEQITGGGIRGQDVATSTMRALTGAPQTWVVTAKNLGTVSTTIRAEVFCLAVVP